MEEFAFLAVVPTKSLRIFYKTVQCIARISDMVYIDPHLDSIHFRTLNESRSAFADFRYSGSFFEDYSMSIPKMEQLAVQVKPLVAFLKGWPNTEKCTFCFDLENQKLQFNMVCKKHVTKQVLCFSRKQFTLSTEYILDPVRANYSVSECPNTLVARPKTLSDTLAPFSQSLLSCALYTSPSSGVRLRSLPNENATEAALTTDIKLDLAGFEPGTQFPEELEVHFNLREFRAMVGVCEQLGQSMTVHIPLPGGPLAIMCRWFNAIEVEFVVATQHDKHQSQQTPRSQPADVRTGSRAFESNPKRGTSEMRSSQQSAPMPRVKTEPVPPVPAPGVRGSCVIAPGSPEAKRQRSEQFAVEDFLPKPLGDLTDSDDEEEVPGY